ncbi:MAG TPA: cation diffusion facilitator family transporter [Blastocatellia bacterium]|nr:cation diffusion facilitator family transporter [Blastocatellia bacterium]
MAAPAHHHHNHNHNHAHDHAHDHAHSHGTPQRVLMIVLGMNVIYMLAEAVGGWWANSLALLSDAGHMLADIAAIALSLFAARFAQRPATPSKTYGFYRMEILAALANGVTLIMISLLICYEAWHRLRRTEVVEAKTMIAISLGGLLVNLISAKVLHGAHAHNLNLRGAFLHVLGDLLGSLVAVIAGLLILWRGWLWTDPVFSVLICVLIVYSSWRLVSEAVNVLLEGAPSHIDAAAVEAAMRTVNGVRDIHDLHIWTITSNRYAVTAHVVIAESESSYRILRELRELLAEQFGLTHSTLQIEDPYLSAMVKLEKPQKPLSKSA